jgi:hypothetical protein
MRVKISKLTPGEWVANLKNQKNAKSLLKQNAG